MDDALVSDDTQEAARRQAKEQEDRLAALGHRLLAEAERRKGQRAQVEQRWLRDMRAYNNQYEPQHAGVLASRRYGSKAFVPLTRRICNIVEARLGDLLFPTDERGFSIAASPVPELSEAQADADRLPPGHALPAGNGATVTARSVSLAIRELREEAGKRAAAMQRQVDDRLKEADWPSVGRRAIHQALVLGTAVVKGPMVLGRTKKRRSQVQPGVFVLVAEQDMVPTAVGVDVWDFFPDTSARTLKQSESEYELHRLNKAEFAKLAQQPGFENAVETIRDILRTEPPMIRDSNQEALREASGTQGVDDKRWWVWEYHGPIDTDDLRACECEVPDDPLIAYEGVVWFSNDGRVLKAAINPMDTDERPYSVFNWQQDDTSIYGYGLPYELRDLQDAANSTFRAVLDNGGLSVGPMLVINRKKLSPVNGRWEIEPNKLFETTDRTEDVRALISAVEIPSRVPELLNLFTAIKSMLDEIGGPMLAMQGSEAPSLMKTDLGKSIAYSAANVWMKRAVKNFDDQITTPLISRFVDWEMQYNEDASIKGDMKIIARGTSALIEAEGQVQRTLSLVEAAKDVPMPIKRRINMLRAMAKAMRLDDADILPDDDEVRAFEEAEKKAREQGPPMDPEMARIEIRKAEIADNQAEREHSLAIEKQRADIRLAEIASREGLTIEQARQRYGIEELKLEAQLADRQAQREHDAQKFNAELVTKQRMGTGI